MMSAKRPVEDPMQPLQKPARKLNWLWRLIDWLRYGKKKP